MTINIDEDRRIIAAATPGPWEWSRNTLTNGEVQVIDGDDFSLLDQDISFIAEARTRWWAALDALEEMTHLRDAYIQDRDCAAAERDALKAERSTMKLALDKTLMLLFRCEEPAEIRDFLERTIETINRGGSMDLEAAEIVALKAEVALLTIRAEKWRQNYDLAVENTTLEQTARLKAEAEVARLKSCMTLKKYESYMDENARLREAIADLYRGIAHGDETHRSWLKGTIDAHFRAALDAAGKQ